MQVDRERVHRHDFAVLGSHETGKARRYVLMIGQPRMPGVKMPFYGKLAPIGEFLLDVLPGFFGHEPQGVPGEIELIFPASALGEYELPAIRS